MDKCRCKLSLMMGKEMMRPHLMTSIRDLGMDPLMKPKCWLPLECPRILRLSLQLFLTTKTFRYFSTLRYEDFWQWPRFVTALDFYWGCRISLCFSILHSRLLTDCKLQNKLDDVPIAIPLIGVMPKNESEGLLMESLTLPQVLGCHSLFVLNFNLHLRKSNYTNNSVRGC